MALVAFILVTAAAAALGAQFMPGEWYVGLSKPAWTPPGWVFAPVWTTLYIMIAVAGWLIWRTGWRSAAMAIWAISLVFNAAWSWLFFGRHAISVALVDIALMWLSIAAFIIVAWPRDRTASLLFIPYLAWVSLATALNLSIYLVNR
jgi:translocator protein